MAIRFGSAIVVAVFATCGFLGAQARQNPATLDDLLTEIRGLRGDIARSSSATVRTQMFVARMQIQETRIDTVLRQITDVQNQIAQVRQMVAAIEGPLKQAETDFARSSADIRVSAEERQQTQYAFSDMKQRFGPQLAQAQQRMQELALRESELLNQFSTEQIRWNEFNDRLDALERSLQSQ
jgi:chromosome segregation ATPase